MKRFIVPALPDETSEEEDVYELTHIDHLFIRDRIEIPGFSNYETLKCDFHTHTVFSDGLVWPMPGYMRLAGGIGCDSDH